ncbi:PAS domain-containing protein [Hwanghaeella grinnelliae]
MNTMLARPARRRSLKPPSLEEFLSYWDSKKSGRTFPSRLDLDPVDIPNMLPFVFLVDVLGQGHDFRYRLVGTDIVRNTKKDFTGYLLSEIREIGSQGKLIEMYQRTVADKAPVTERLPFKTRGGVKKFYDVAVTPLSRNGEVVDMLFGYALHGENVARSGVDI